MRAFLLESSSGISQKTIKTNALALIRCNWQREMLIIGLFVGLDMLLTLNLHKKKLFN